MLGQSRQSERVLWLLLFAPVFRLYQLSPPHGYYYGPLY